ncbi:uncharacterized protein J3D65DRAFT_618689 [Phyllosticta citribraziliensis]|uniref:Uncharacterized protein n=1 Tax=Phyllosticta citribraziliensis TaxID=989973 RepID=A0ABR1LW82_9PEZI
MFGGQKNLIWYLSGLLRLICFDSNDLKTLRQHGSLHLQASLEELQVQQGRRLLRFLQLQLQQQCGAGRKDARASTHQQAISPRVQRHHRTWPVSDTPQEEARWPQNPHHRSPICRRFGTRNAPRRIAAKRGAPARRTAPLTARNPQSRRRQQQPRLAAHRQSHRVHPLARHAVPDVQLNPLRHVARRQQPSASAHQAPRAAERPH